MGVMSQKQCWLHMKQFFTGLFAHNIDKNVVMPKKLYWATCTCTQDKETLNHNATSAPFSDAFFYFVSMVILNNFSTCRISTESLFAVPGRSGVTKWELADLLCDVGSPSYVESKKNPLIMLVLSCSKYINWSYKLCLNGYFEIWF